MKLYFLFLLLAMCMMLRFADLVDPIPFTETVQGTLQYMSFAFTIVLTFMLNASHDRFIQQGQISKALVNLSHLGF